MAISATKTDRVLERWAVVALVALVMIGCTLRPGETTEEPSMPLPEGASEIEVIDLGQGSREVGFRLECEYRSRAIVDFYGDWAEDLGWEKVPETEESWSMDRWDQFGPPWDQTDQYFVHWRSPDRKWSLRIVARHRADRSHQVAAVQLVPYQILP